MLKKLLFMVLPMQALFTATYTQDLCTTQRSASSKLYTMLRTIRSFIMRKQPFKKISKNPKRSYAVIQKKTDDGVSLCTLLVGAVCFLLIGMPYADMVWHDTVNNTVRYAQ